MHVISAARIFCSKVHVCKIYFLQKLISRTGLWSNNTTMNLQKAPASVEHWLICTAREIVGLQDVSPALYSGTTGCHSPAAHAVPAAVFCCWAQCSPEAARNHQTSWGWKYLSKSSKLTKFSTYNQCLLSVLPQRWRFRHVNQWLLSYM